VPCFNEALVMTTLHERLGAACRAVSGDDYEIVLVNDGSRDNTWASIHSLMQTDPHVVGVNLSRNFGHQAAVAAGLDQSVGDRVLVIDADLQDPPEVLGDMMALMDRERADVVFGVRDKRDAETVFKKLTAALFYRIFRFITELDMPADAGDFRLMSRRAVTALRAMPESRPFLRGMVTWIGFKQVAFRYHRHGRLAGKTGYSLRRMVRFALDAITGYSMAPLHLATTLSMMCLPMAALLLIYIAFSWLIGRTVDGWTSMMTVLVFFGSVQLLVLGILGEYVGRLVMESKRRPLYIVDSVVRRREAQRAQERDIAAVG
jgi:dolichol-phosphate mannosyltransferase